MKRMWFVRQRAKVVCKERHQSQFDDQLERLTHMNDAKNDRKFHLVALDIDDELHRKRSFALTTH